MDALIPRHRAKAGSQRRLLHDLSFPEPLILRRNPAVGDAPTLLEATSAELISLPATWLVAMYPPHPLVMNVRRMGPCNCHLDLSPGHQISLAALQRRVFERQSK